MVTVVPPDPGWSEAFERLGTGITQGYTQRSDEMALQKSLEGLGENASPQDVLKAITATKTYSPQAKQTALQNYLGVEKFSGLQKKAAEESAYKKAQLALKERELGAKEAKAIQEREATRNIVNQLDLPDAQKQVLGDSLSLDKASDLLANQVKGNKPGLTKGEEALQKKHIEEYVKLEQELPTYKTTLENIDYAEKLAKELRSPLSGVVGTETAKELEAVSFPLIQPIVKMFNPTGPIAQQKLKLIQDKYQIKPTDFSWQSQGKINALRRFAKQGNDRIEKRIKLLEQYDFLPPKNVIEQFDRETETLSDAMMDYDLVGEEVKAEGMPDVKAFKGKTVTSPDGQKYHSDGTRWVKK